MNEHFAFARRFHNKTTALENEIREEENKVDPLDYTEYQITQLAGELVQLTRRSYAAQKLRDLAYQIEAQAGVVA